MAKIKKRSLNEQFTARKTRDIEQAAEIYESLYPAQKEIVTDKAFPLAHFRSQDDQTFAYVQCCRALDNLKEEFAFRREAAGLSIEESLGAMTALEKAAMSAVPVYFAESPASVICGIQTLEAQNGLIMWYGYKARDTRNDFTAGDSYVRARTGFTKYGKYASTKIQNATVGTGNGSATHFSITSLAYLPIRKQRCSIAVADSTTVYAKDYDVSPSDQNIGILSGAGVTGTINYTTGAVSLDFITAPADTKVVSITYEQDIEGASQVPRLQLDWRTTQVEAQFIPLEGSTTVGQLHNLRKTWGSNFTHQQLAKDLLGALQQEIFSLVVAGLVANAPSGNDVTFSRGIPSGGAYSPLERQKTFRLAISDANQKIFAASQFGGVNWYICGNNTLQTMESMEGYKKMYKRQGVGAQIVGSLDGDPVVHMALDENAGGLDTDTILMGYRGDSFRVASMIGMWLPFATESMVPSTNILEKRSVAYTAVSIDVLNTALISKCTLSDGVFDIV